MMRRRLSYNAQNTPIHSDENSSRKMKLSLDRENIMNDLKMVCLCKSQCIEEYKIKDVIAARVVYHSKNEVEKLQWLIDSLMLKKIKCHYLLMVDLFVVMHF